LDDAVTSTFIDTKTRRCTTCRACKPEPEFPADKFGRVDIRMCLQCVDEHTPMLMTEAEIAKWLGVAIAEVRTFDVAGSYTTPRGATIPLYARRAVCSDYLPVGWRGVFDG
jgi:hypothetical protein